ncbi:MAG TPA: RNA-binding cell elongation regulator Jag/EloR, partial [Candidatus Acidoferrales bacterium]|nr:RNA-binding cell elongation regulator Jag/EloR [Candidatus Acidoferrales bacterium]
DSIDAAIDNALRQLGTTRDRVEVEILSNASRGLLGIGGRKARVRASLRKSLLAESHADDSQVAGGNEPDRGSGSAVSPVQSQPRRVETAATSELSAADREIAERARASLIEIVKHVGIDADVEIRSEEGQILLVLTGDTSGMLIGRRGQMLDALEYILNRIALKDHSEATRITIDSENYRARRRDSLEQTAHRMADQAKKRRKAVTLNPMSPRDRRIIHLALQNDPELTTKSSGEGYYRKLVIIPKGATRSPRSSR